MTWRSVVAAAALALAAGSCASSAKPAAGAPYEMEKQTITQYWMQIREWRVELGMTTEPAPQTVEQFRDRPVPKPRCKQDPDPKSAHCQDVCNVSRAICDNAEDICRIARDMHNDTWAIAKCTSAKASCQEAAQKCCDCASKESSTASAHATMAAAVCSGE